MIKEETIIEFQQIVAEEYGREITISDARKIMSDLVAYFDLLAKIEYRRMTTIENPEVIPEKN